MKKIEELHFELSQEKEKINDYIKENNYYKDLIVQHEQEIKFFKKQIENKIVIKYVFIKTTKIV